VPLSTNSFNPRSAEPDSQAVLENGLPYKLPGCHEDKQP